MPLTRHSPSGGRDPDSKYLNPSKRLLDSGDELPAKRRRLLSNHPEAINVRVGIEPNTHTFGVGREVISQQSRFFATSCSGRWAEGQTSLVKLPEEDPEIFATYLKWIHDDVLILKTTSFASDEEKRRRRYELLDWYAFADRTDDKKLRNHIVSRLAVVTEMKAAIKDSDFVAAVYGQTSASASPLRKMLVDHFTAYGRSIDLREKEYPARFVADIAYRAVDREDASMPYADASRYHE
ncbi:hypothetical protein LTR95_013970 [Oleoguttula sp. CCFEE 5521]